MDDREILERRLDMAKQALAILEQRAAGYTALTIPVDLFIDLSKKREEVAQIEAMLAGNGGELFPNTLPRRDMFFGRADEMARVLAALAPEDRSWGALVDGIGGIGKTALAVECAYRCQDAGRFEVFLFATAKQTRLDPGGECDLHNATDLDSLLGTLARALGEPGVLQAPAAEKPQALIEALRRFSGPQRRVLLILDNLETLPVDEQQAAVEFLRQLPPHCKGLATSRKRAGDGAVFVRLEKLAWDAARQIMEEEAKRDAGLARALEQAGEAHWQTLHDAAGGSPLALRWALGLMRQRHLSLERAVALLHGQQADDLLQFMYREARNDLAENDWQLLGALSLFAAPASFEALAATTGLSRLALEAATERLSAYALVDVGGPDGPYSLHPLTRRMAADELAGQPERGAKLRHAFARYWVDYAQKYGGSGKDAYQTYDKLQAEWPNLEAAAGELWALSGLPGTLKDAEAAKMLNDLAVALCGAAGPLFFRGYWNESVRLSEQAYAANIAREAWRDAGWAAYHVAWIHYHRAETDRAATWAERMGKAMERSGNRRCRATATQLRGQVAQQREDYPEAERLLTEALAAYRKLGAEEDQATALNSLCELAWAREDYDRAEDYLREALALAKKVGNKEHHAIYTGNLGLLALDRDRPAEARPLFERALALGREVGREDEVARYLWGLARVLEKEGHIAEALPLAEESLRIRERLRHGDVEASRALVARLRERAVHE